MHNHVEPSFFKKVTQQESYPLLKVKEENAFFNLPKNIYTAEQEIINLNEENVVEIDDSDKDQDLTLFKQCRHEIFELFNSAKRILEENKTNPNGNKWLDSIDKNFEPMRKFVEDFILTNSWTTKNITEIRLRS
ncbi:28170_t:CDS:2 [Dentiscutata erythropus]|uniref:28170_t:CDS:1 n=1 Tax=Dentiscutata erythropus TaxID=1348616 RepID=A0A9N9I6M2_9GLOM|nr:28170_t:CDS:2 [Dentiscutata erythropus]